jgi:hypothetical protein
MEWMNPKSYLSLNVVGNAVSLSANQFLLQAGLSFTIFEAFFAIGHSVYTGLVIQFIFCPVSYYCMFCRLDLNFSRAICPD